VDQGAISTLRTHKINSLSLSKPFGQWSCGRALVSVVISFRLSYLFYKLSIVCESARTLFQQQAQHQYRLQPRWRMAPPVSFPTPRRAWPPASSDSRPSCRECLVLRPDQCRPDPVRRFVWCLGGIPSLAVHVSLRRRRNPKDGILNPLQLR
jgi:hypothetical protein